MKKTRPSPSSLHCMFNLYCFVHLKEQISCIQWWPCQFDTAIYLFPLSINFSALSPYGVSKSKCIWRYGTTIAAQPAKLCALYQTKGWPEEIGCHHSISRWSIVWRTWRNAIWTFQDGETSYERLGGIDTETADWHAKYTLYKVIKFPLNLLVWFPK